MKKRFPETSSSKDIFDHSLKLYQDALTDSGFSNDLRYVENNNIANDAERKQKQKIVWFNPPFSKSVKPIFAKFSFQNSALNRNILNPIVKSYGCNCRVKSSCPLNGECLTPKIIYRANVSNDANNDKKFYFGLEDMPFKERYRNHTRDFKHEKYENSTELVKYIWKLKRSNINFSIKYSITSKVGGNPSSIICQLCLTEKLWIIKFINNKDLLEKKITTY